MQNTEQTVLQALDRLGVAYDYHAHAPAMTMDDLKSLAETTGVPHAKNLFLTNRQKTMFYLLLLPGDQAFRTAVLSKQLGVARLSFGDAEHMWQFLKCKPGAISPLGLLFDREKRVQLVIDQALLEEKKLNFHPCVNTASLSLATSDFVDLFIRETGHKPIWVKLME